MGIRAVASSLVAPYAERKEKSTRPSVRDQHELIFDVKRRIVLNPAKAGEEDRFLYDDAVKRA